MKPLFKNRWEVYKHYQGKSINAWTLFLIVSLFLLIISNTYIVKYKMDLMDFQNEAVKQGYAQITNHNLKWKTADEVAIAICEKYPKAAKKTIAFPPFPDELPNLNKKIDKNKK